MKKRSKKMSLKKETLRSLSDGSLSKAIGGSLACGIVRGAPLPPLPPSLPTISLPPNLSF